MVFGRWSSPARMQLESLSFEVALCALSPDLPRDLRSSMDVAVELPIPAAVLSPCCLVKPQNLCGSVTQKGFSGSTDSRDLPSPSLGHIWDLMVL